LFDTGNPAALAAAAARLLDDPAHRASLAAAACVAVREFDWSVIARDILRVYQAVAPAAGRVAVAL
jgi:phosphatidylinositol alpha-mannosyltransferase